MLQYIARRAIQAAIILIFLSGCFFALLNTNSNGVCARFESSPDRYAQVKYRACLAIHDYDKPIVVQYMAWLGRTIHGDFGKDAYGQSVGGDIAAALPATFLLIGVSYIFQQLLAFPLGMIGALRQNGILDVVFTICSYIFLAMPTFWLAFLLIIFFSTNVFKVFPPSGIFSTTYLQPPYNIQVFGDGSYWHWAIHNIGPAIGDMSSHIVLPALTLALGGIAGDSRFIRASMLDVMNQDYIRTARAKGLPRPTIVFKHVLRNALLPVITNVGVNFVPTLIAGAIVTETIFTWRGTGYLFSSSLTNNDTNTMLAIILLTSLFVILGNLLADIGYAWADPRIRYS